MCPGLARRVLPLSVLLRTLFQERVSNFTVYIFFQFIYLQQNKNLFSSFFFPNRKTTMTATLIMVAKYPQPNKCKTRLAARIGADGAAAFARAALCDLLERLAAEEALSRRVLLFAPVDQREVFDCILRCA